MQFCSEACECFVSCPFRPNVAKNGSVSSRPPGQLAPGSTRPRVSSPRPIHMFIGDVISTGVIMHQSFVSTAPPPMGMGEDNGFSFFRALV